MKTRVLFVLLILVGIVTQVFSRQALVEKSQQSIPFAQRDHFTLVDPAQASVLALNYDTFASSLAWVSALLYFGEWKMSKSNDPPAHLERYAEAIVALDPMFIDIYEWFNATYIGSHHLPGRTTTFDDLETLRRFNEQGIRDNPSLWRLPYVTGMNYIGYSYEREPEERLIEIDHAIHYLTQCVRFSPCPETVPFTLSYLYRLRQSLDKGESMSDEEFVDVQLALYRDLYTQTMDPAQRARIALNLKDLGMSEDAIAALENPYLNQFKRAYETRRSYLPLDLWALTVYPTPDSLSLISQD